jgi:hypothetical protein
VEITVKVPLDQAVTLPAAVATAQTRALRHQHLDQDAHVTGVAICADGRRLEIGDDKLVEWGLR